MKPRICIDNNKGKRKHGGIIVPKNTSASRSSHLYVKCDSCECGKERCRAIHKTGKRKLFQALRSRKLSPGELIFVDQYKSSVCGRLPNSRVKNALRINIVVEQFLSMPPRVIREHIISSLYVLVIHFGSIMLLNKKLLNMVLGFNIIMMIMVSSFVVLEQMIVN